MTALRRAIDEAADTLSCGRHRHRARRRRTPGRAHRGRRPWPTRLARTRRDVLRPIPRARHSPRPPNPLAALDDDRRIRSGDARRRARRLHPASGDRGATGMGARTTAFRCTRRSSTCARDRGRWPSRSRTPGHSAHRRRRRLRRSAGLRATQPCGHRRRTARGRRHRAGSARRPRRAGRPRSSPTRPTFPTAPYWNPKSPNMIRRTRSSAARTACGDRADRRAGGPVAAARRTAWPSSTMTPPRTLTVAMFDRWPGRSPRSRRAATSPADPGS